MTYFYLIWIFLHVYPTENVLLLIVFLNQTKEKGSTACSLPGKHSVLYCLSPRYQRGRCQSTISIEQIKIEPKPLWQMSSMSQLLKEKSFSWSCARRQLVRLKMYLFIYVFGRAFPLNRAWKVLQMEKRTPGIFTLSPTQRVEWKVRR